MNVKVRWINFTGKTQVRTFTEKQSKHFIAMLQSAGLKVISTTQRGEK